MLQSPSYAYSITEVLLRHVLDRARPILTSRMGRLAFPWIMALALLAISGSAFGQFASTSEPQATTQSQGALGDNVDSSAEPDENADSTRSNLAAPEEALSSDQIIQILQDHPDLLMELKSELADRLQEQGAQIDPSDIPDQALYSRIAEDPSLRAKITTVLRERGYVSQDLQPSAPSVAGGGALSSPSSQQSLSGAGATEENRAITPRARAAAMNPCESGRTSQTDQTLCSGVGRTERLGNPREREKANASTDLPKVLHLPAPYDMEVLHDLYAQIPLAPPRLKRFGSDVFVNRGGESMGMGTSLHNIPLDVPLGPDYVVGPGDTLSIDIWGGVTQRITRTIDRDGRILLPEAGSVELAGLPLGKVQNLIEAALKPQYRKAQVVVTISGLRSVRVYVVGDVQRPGGYDISSLATPVSALYAAGGPTAVGSLRTLLHYRGTLLVERVDLYDFLLHGIRNGSASFESGDTILVPPAGPQVAIFGAVKRPAIYELKAGETTLSSAIDDAGGFTAAASLNQIRIERIEANQQRVTTTLPDDSGQDLQVARDEIAKFQVKDGDRICVEPILPYSQRAIYLTGHVVRPGRLPYTEGLRLSDVLRSYRDLLPEPSDRGEIIRLVAPDLHPEAIEFNVSDVLIGNSNIPLKDYDTVRIFGRYQADAPEVTIDGEVLRPGNYPMSKGMTAAQLVRMAGGFKRDALLATADLTSYEVRNGDRVVEQLATVPIGAALSGADPKADVELKPGDILSIHQITNWDDIGESVTISGQVRFPGSYGFTDGGRLSSVLRRAGGLLSTAYPMGAVLTRVEVRDLQKKSRDELIRQIETNAAAARLSPVLASSNGAAALQVISTQQNQVISELKNHPPSGRMVIHISADIGSWANTPADIELRRGDVLTIPKRPGFVLITGQVYNATAVTYAPGKNAEWYLRRAGGTNSTANRKEIFIIRANGSVIGRHSGGWFDNDVLSTKLNPGDVVVVPQKIIGGSFLWRNLLTAGQLAASVAITASVATAAL